MAARILSTIDDITSYYRDNAELYGIESPRTMGYHKGPVDDRLLKHILPQSVPETFSILDVGCGLGQIVPVAAERFPNSDLVRLVGLDLVEEFVRYCSEKYLRYEFRTKNFLNWNSKEQFDVVVAAGVLVTRISDYETYLEKCIEKMIDCSNYWIGFNVVGNQGESYTAKHLATISEASLNKLLKRFSGVDWTVHTEEVFPGSADTFVCGTRR